jgi:AcrR family transcriptional regulator
MNQISIGTLRAITDTGRPNQRAMAKQRTREKILSAATTLFSERGYEGATIRDIAKAAGMSTGAVFASFADKSDLFGEIVALEQQALEAVVLAAAEKPGKGPTVLAMLEAAAERHMADLALFQATMSAVWAPGLGAELRRRLRRHPITGLIAEALRTDLECAAAQGLDRAFLAEVVWDAYISTLRRAALDKLSPEAVKGRLRRQVTLIFNGACAG